MDTKEFAVGLLCEKGKCLAKKRILYEEQDKYSHNVFFPKGPLREGERPNEALRRIIQNDLGVEVLSTRFVGRFIYREGAIANVFIVDSWDGKPRLSREIVKFFWIDDENRLTNEFDRAIFRRAYPLVSV